MLRRQAGQRHDYRFSRAIGVEEQFRLKDCTNALQVFAGQRFAAGDAHAHRQGLTLDRQPLRQLAAIAGGETENIDLLLTNQRADFFGVPLALRAQYHACAAEQRHQQTLGGGIEVDRIEMQFAVVRLHVEATHHRLAMHGDFTMGHHHALGLAGRTGGVNQVRLMLRQADKRQFIGRESLQQRLIVFQAPVGHTGRQLAQRGKQRSIAQQQTDAAVFDHVVQAFQRVFRVERHVGATGLEDCQQADNHVQRARQRQTSPHLRADAALAQHSSQLVGTGVQLGVTQGFAGKGQRRRLWAQSGLFGKQAVNALIETLLARFNTEAVEQLLALGVLQQRQLTQTLLRIDEQRLQQVQPMFGHLRDARFVEQIGAVGQAATQAVIQLGDFQVEVEFGSPRIVDQVVDSHARQLAALLEFPALHVAHHLEQRVVGRAAWRLQGFDQMIERQVLMRLTFNYRVAHLFK
ncbi:Uncharacterized protein AC506_5044 [Pseudomonas syringae pv. maculicola str. M6]|nr:Uncharacterized protein AC506_5044 [Pseudomonas syringae pv. maculicola str. M6]